VGARLLSSRQENILLLRLDSNDGFPRLKRAILRELGQEIAHLARNNELVGAVITGTDRAFAAGAEISEIANLAAAEAFEFSRFGQSVMREIENSKRPVIAAIRGYCMGGGFDLALTCHARIAAPDATFAHPGGSLGIITGWGGTQRCSRLIGHARALELFVTGTRIGADEALAWGLINTIAPAEQAVPAAVRLAAELAAARS